ncbi:YuzF family protein [Bacillus sp. Bva_UNVM-123]|uniref:YuzF family protein n=1 Tax=Bacillus sp. Bva_UNVM-123 TaxID=2829798 RepID=UPI00391F462D
MSMNQETSSYVSHIDPYVYHTLQSIIKSMVIVETTKGTVSGSLKSVMPDHIIVESGGSSFFIRTQQIVWVIPKG